MIKVRKLSLFIATLTIISLILTSINMKSAYADQIIVSGQYSLDLAVFDDDILEIGANMLPGEKIEGRMRVTNTDTRPFILYINVAYIPEPLEAEGPEVFSELLDKLNITVSQGGNVLTSFPAKGGGPYQLGRLDPNGMSTLNVKVEMQEDADDAYQSRLAHLIWTFTAEGIGGPNPTPSPTPAPPDDDDDDSPPSGPVDRPRTPGSATGGGTVITTSPPAAPELIEIPEEPVPLGNPQIPSINDTEEIIEILPEEIPLGTIKANPKTGVESKAFRNANIAFFAVSAAIFFITKKASIKN